jgi:YVTN family beta-propeller protein
VIDPDAGLETTRITLSDTGQSGRVSYAGAGSILLDRSGIKAYVLNAVSNCISIIDIPNRALVATVATESVPLQAEFNKKGDRLYMIYDGSPYLNVLDPGTLFSIKKAYVGMQPAAIKVDTNTDMVYVARKREAEVSVYDPFSLLPVESIKAESSSDFMTIDNESNNLLLLSFKDETVTAVQLNSKNILSAIQIGKSPYRVRVIGER